MRSKKKHLSILKQKVFLKKSLQARIVNKLMQCGKKQILKRIYLNTALKFKMYSDTHSGTFFLQKMKLLISPVEVKERERIKRQGNKIAKSIKKKLKEKNKRFNTFLVFPVRISKQYVKLISILVQQIRDKRKLRKNLNFRLFTARLNLVNLKQSKLFKIKQKKEFLASNIKVTSLSKKKRWY